MDIDHVRGTIVGGTAEHIGGNFVCAHKNLTLNYVSATTVDIDADTVILENATDGSFKRFDTLNDTLIITGSGAGGLDTGSEAASTWYHVWAIGQDDGTVDAILSVAYPGSGSVTLPAGYDWLGYCGAIRNDSSSDFLEMYQAGLEVASEFNSMLSSGSVATNTAISHVAFVPQTARVLCGYMGVDDTNGTGFADCLLSAVDNAQNVGLNFNRTPGGVTANNASYCNLRIVLIDRTNIWYRVNNTDDDAFVVCSGWAY